MFSQVVTLFLTPVVYIYMEDAKAWGTRIFGRETAWRTGSGFLLARTDFLRPHRRADHALGGCA